MNGLFKDRAEAGRILAPKLREYANRRDVIVLALPRGGVPVACEIARKLHVDLDLLIVRKLGVPGQEELAMGAIASGGIEYHDHAIIEALGISAADIAAVSARERQEVERRERLYREGRPPPSLRDKTVILVDDGIATGSSMRAAIRLVASKGPHRTVVAAPVASAEAVDVLRCESTAVVTVLTTPHLFAVGEYYRDFRQLEDKDVRRLFAAFYAKDGKSAA